MVKSVAVDVHQVLPLAGGLLPGPDHLWIFNLRTHGFVNIARTHIGRCVPAHPRPRSVYISVGAQLKIGFRANMEPVDDKGTSAASLLRPR